MIDNSLFFRSHYNPYHWDTWAFFNDSQYYLYYLIVKDGRWGAIGAAVSSDGVTWDDKGIVIEASDLMVKYLGSGAVWRSVDSDIKQKYIMNYSEYRLDETGNPIQRILFAQSNDLLHWTKLDDSTMFNIDEKYYEKNGRWDCIYAMPLTEGGYFGCWTATPKGSSNMNGGVGFGVSLDGLKWTALKPPVFNPPTYEIGAVERLGLYYYAMCGDDKDFQMKAYRSLNLYGPYERQERNMSFLSKNTYFSRFVQTGDELLVVNHIISQQLSDFGCSICYVAPFKLAVEEAGVLWLKYWQGNDGFFKDHKKYTLDSNNNSYSFMDNNPYFCEAVIDVDFNTEVLLKTEYNTKISITISNQKVTIDDTSQTGNLKQEVYVREREFNKLSIFKLLLRDSVTEIYLDDYYFGNFVASGYIKSIEIQADDHFKL